MRRLLLERALNMKKNSLRPERGFLVLAAIMLACLGAANAATTGVTYTVDNQSNTVPTIEAAAGAVNFYVTNDAQDSDTVAKITLNQSSYTALGATPAGAWVFDGAADPTNYRTGRNYGFDDLSIGGISSKSTLSANGRNTMLLKLLNAHGDLAASNLVLSGGSYGYQDIRAEDQNVMGKVAGGAGLTIGSNGVYGGSHNINAPTSISVATVNAAGNSIVLSGASHATDLRGAGILVNAYGLTSGTASDPNAPYNPFAADSTFTNVNLTDNRLSLTKVSSYTEAVEALGGGAAVMYGKSFTYSSGTVSGNSATVNNGSGDYAGAIEAAGGGLYASAKDNSVSGVTFKNNYVHATSSLATNYYEAAAFGGAASFDYAGTGTQTNNLANLTVQGNYAKADGNGNVLAAGGAFHFGGDENSTIANSSITGNYASSTYNALGGAIFLEGGALDLLNTSLTGNSVTTNASAGRAEGSAIFADTQGTTSGITMFADAGKTVAVEGNTANGSTTRNGIVFGRLDNSATGYSTNGTSGLYLTGNGTHKLLNGLTVDMLKDPATSAAYGFTFAKGATTDHAGTGALYLDGEYSFSTPNGSSHMNVNSGTLYLGNNFVAYNKNLVDGTNTHKTAFNVNLQGVSGITFDLSRDANSALFNFANADTDSMTVDPNTKVTTTGYARSVASYDYTYTLAKGLSATNLNTLQQYLYFDSSGNRYTTGDLDIVNNSLVANVKFTSPFQFAGPNARSAQYPLQNLIDSAWGRSNITDTEIGYWLGNPLMVTPNLYAEQVDIMFNGADRVATTAVYTGLKQAHRAKLYNEQYQAGRDRYLMRRGGTYSAPGGRYYDPGYPSGAGIQGGVIQPGAVQGGYNGGIQTGGMGAQAGIQAGGMGIQGGYSAGVQGGGVGVQGGMVGGGVGAGGGDYNYNSSSAFPSARLMDCASLYDGYGFRLWGGYIGDFRSKSADDGYAGYKSTRHGFLVGLNYDWGAVATAGFYAGYSHTRTNSRATDEHLRGDNAHVGLMARLSPFERNREFSLYADIGYHYAHNRYNRGVGAGYEANTSFNQNLFGFGLGVEQIFRLGGVNLIPHFELRYGDLGQSGMSEGGTSSALTVVDGPSADAFNTRLGVELGKDFYTYGTAFTPTIGVAWRHDYGDRQYETFGRYSHNPEGGSFLISSGKTSRDSADISAALKTLTDMGGGTTLGFNLSYNINLAGKTTTQTVYAGVEVGF